MPYYNGLKRDVRDKTKRADVAARLLKLSEQLDAEVPDKDADDHLLLATWNLRDFGKTNRRGWGPRMADSHYYIAEVLSRFDFVAVQEVNELDEWDQVMRILGRDWSFVATDVTDPALGGNGERLLFLYDRRKVSFQGIAGEIVLPNKMLIQGDSSGDEAALHAGKQFRRSPFLARFQAGWFKFDICTVHIYYGNDSGPKLKERIDEIDRVAQYFGKRAEKELKHGRSLILLGDFNIKHPEHETMTKLLDAGFKVPKALRRPTNLDGTKFYDQIAFMTQKGVLEFVDAQPTNGGIGNAGVFEMFRRLYNHSHLDDYREQVLKSTKGKALADNDEDGLKKVYKEWRTYQLSDHKPMWVRVRCNDGQTYLKGMSTG